MTEEERATLVAHEHALMDENTQLQNQVFRLEEEVAEATLESDDLRADLDDQESALGDYHDIVNNIENEIIEFHEENHPGSAGWCQEAPCYGVFKAIGAH